MNIFIKKQSDLGKKAVKLVLEYLFEDLELIQIPRMKKQKTPDYKIISKTGEIVAICEVKTCIPSLVLSKTPLYKKIANKIKDHHLKAVKQMSSYLDSVKMIVYVSLDGMDHLDLQEMLNNHPEIERVDLYMVIKVKQQIASASNFSIQDTCVFLTESIKGKNVVDKYMSNDLMDKNRKYLPLNFNV